MDAKNKRKRGVQKVYLQGLGWAQSEGSRRHGRWRASRTGAHDGGRTGGGGGGRAHGEQDEAARGRGPREGLTARGVWPAARVGRGSGQEGGGGGRGRGGRGQRREG